MHNYPSDINAIAIGRNATAIGTNDIVLGTDATVTKFFNSSGNTTSYIGTQIGIAAVAIGRSARSTATNTVAIGTSAFVDSNNSVGIGTNAGSIYGWSGKVQSPAWGLSTDAGSSVTIGNNAKSFITNGPDVKFVNAFNAVAIGTNTHTHAAYTVAIGSATDATGERSFALGTTSTNNGTTPHKGSRSAGQGSIAIGDTALVLGNESLIGKDEERRTTDANDGIAIGTKTRASAVNTITIGGAVSYTEPVYNSTTGSYELKTSYGFNKDGYPVTLGDDGDMGSQGAYTELEADAGIAIGGASEKLKTEAARTLRAGGIAIGSGALVGRRDIDWERQAILTSQAYKDALNAYNTAWAAWVPYKDGTIVAPVREDYASDEAYQAALDDYNTKYAAASADYASASATYTSLRNAIKAQLENLNGHAAPINGVAIGTGAAVEVQGGVALGSYSVVDVSRDRSGNVSGMTGYDPLTGEQYAGADKESGVWKSVWGSVSVGRNGYSDIVLSADNQYYIVGNNGTVYEAYVLSDDGKTYDRYTSADMAAEKHIWVASKVPEQEGTSIDITDTIRVTRRISNVAAGVYDTDAVNVAQLRRATSMDTDNRAVTMKVTDTSGVTSSPYLHINGVSPTVTPDDLAQAEGKDAIAMGRQANATYKNSIAIGYSSHAGGE
ncbi:MAG: hypothetical protein IJU32_00355, partial [Pyramidobacter sp.]|nr:hypothetical protein [Pyramidobacter sp.]